MKVTPGVQAEIRSLKSRGWPVKRIATKLGVSDTSVYKVIHPVKSDREPRNRPKEYRRDPVKDAIRQLTSELDRLRLIVLKRTRSLAKKQYELGMYEATIADVEARRSKLWQLHKRTQGNTPNGRDTKSQD